MNNKSIDVARKSIVDNCTTKKGDILSEKNISTKRLGIGINPMKWNDVLGGIAIKNYQKDELIKNEE